MVVDSTVGAVVGLGNPGEAYRFTRHNVGFDVVDYLADSVGAGFKRSWRLRSRVCKVAVLGRELLLVKPQTYMNRSGRVLARLCGRGMDPSSVLVVVDDIDLEPGMLRVRARGGPGGHNGLKSIVDALGTDVFPRLRVGVGARPADTGLVEHVLGRFTPDERERVDRAIVESRALVECVVSEGVNAAMNKWNTRRRAD